MATTSVRNRNFIGGEWADAASGETFDSTSPADGEQLGTFPRSGGEDVDRAVAAAKAAYEEWRAGPPPPAPPRSPPPGSGASSSSASRTSSPSTRPSSPSS